MPFDTTTTPAAMALRRFLDDNAARLEAAALLLGGEAAAGRTRRLISGTPFGTLHREAGVLLDLLTLRHVGDPDRIESARFALIRPTDPRVPALCRLADGLGEVLDALDDRPATA